MAASRCTETRDLPGCRGGHHHGLPFLIEIVDPAGGQQWQCECFNEGKLPAKWISTEITVNNTCLLQITAKIKSLLLDYFLITASLLLDYFLITAPLLHFISRLLYYYFQITS